MRDEILLKEVVEALGMPKRGKTAGHDRITDEMLKNMAPKGAERTAGTVGPERTCILLIM